MSPQNDHELKSHPHPVIKSKIPTDPIMKEKIPTPQKNFRGMSASSPHDKRVKTTSLRHSDPSAKNGRKEPQRFLRQQRPRSIRMERVTYTARAPEEILTKRPKSKSPPAKPAAPEEAFTIATLAKKLTDAWASIPPLAPLPIKKKRWSSSVKPDRLKTEVVLPPRFGDDISTSDTSLHKTLEVLQKNIETVLAKKEISPAPQTRSVATQPPPPPPPAPTPEMTPSQQFKPPRPSKVHDVPTKSLVNRASTPTPPPPSVRTSAKWQQSSSTKPLVQLSYFPPPKAAWVAEAIQKLVDNGTISEEIVSIPEFQEKIGDLYDSAVDKKYKEISSCVKNLVFPEPEQTRSSRRLRSRDNDESASEIPPPSVKSTRPTTRPSSTSVRTADESPNPVIRKKELEQRVSDVLLQMLLKSLVIPGSGKKNASTNTTTGDAKNAMNERFPEWEWDDDDASGGDLEVRSCFVFEGKICPIQSIKKPTSSFAPVAVSKRKTHPDLHGYFRKVIDVRGFENNEISIKYSQEKIFIEGKQLPNVEEGKNYRLVREIICLPTYIQMIDLRVMRGRNNGRLVFEEI